VQRIPPPSARSGGEWLEPEESAWRIGDMSGSAFAARLYVRAGDGGRRRRLSFACASYGCASQGEPSQYSVAYRHRRTQRFKMPGQNTHAHVCSLQSDLVTLHCNNFGDFLECSVWDLLHFETYGCRKSCGELFRCVSP